MGESMISEIILYITPVVVNNSITSSMIAPGGIRMYRIQKLFERIAGIPQEERNRDLAVSLNTSPRLDTESLRLPACWRRRAQVRGIKR